MKTKTVKLCVHRILKVAPQFRARRATLFLLSPALTHHALGFFFFNWLPDRGVYAVAEPLTLLRLISLLRFSVHIKSDF